LKWDEKWLGKERIQERKVEVKVKILRNRRRTK
jgi:hypothetical protein